MTPGEKKLAEVIEKALTDPAFKARLIANPKDTLDKAGLPVPAKATVKIVEDTADTVYIRIPYHPSGALSVDEIEAVVAGFHHADFSGQWGLPTVK
jgi:hypothetical protein